MATIERKQKFGTRIIVKSTSTEIYLSNRYDRLVLTAYKKRANKPFINCYVSNDEAQATICRIVERENTIAQSKAQSKIEQSKGHTLKVGDILYTSWGYEQTNVEFFQVVGLVGKTMVEIREIAAMERSFENNGDSGHLMPAPDSFTSDEVIKKRANAYNRVKIGASRSASPLDYEVLPTGTKVYRALYWSSYH